MLYLYSTGTDIYDIVPIEWLKLNVVSEMDNVLKVYIPYR